MPWKQKSRQPVGRQVATSPRRAPARAAPAPPTLADQKADFTAEGAPPPGKVSTAEPVEPPKSSRE